jgi:hypothetical protein
MKSKLIFLILLVLVFLFPAKLFAQDPSDDTILPISSSSATIAPSPTSINYQLPYPGILPDSPLYPLKVLRDRLVEFFISNPTKKGEFYILEGDKHINSAIFLIENKRNYALAESTVSKGENYMERSFSQVPIIKQRQEIPNELLQHLSISLSKHQEEIKRMEDKAPAEVRMKLHKDYQRAVDLHKKVEASLPH